MTFSRAHFETIVVQNEPYRFVRNFQYGSNKPQLYRSEKTGQQVVYKRFLDLVSCDAAQLAHQTWQRVCDTLVSAGFPDILEMTPMHEVITYIPGATLGDMADKIPNQANIIPILHSTLHSLSYHLDTLAGLGLAHADVKPDNIVLRTDNPTGVPDDTMLIDFNFLHPFGVRDGGKVLGTMQHLAQETACYNKYTSASDAFALAVSSIQTLWISPEALNNDRQTWGRDYFSGPDYEIYQRRRDGIPTDVLEQLSSHMRDSLRRTAPAQEKSVNQLVNFIQSALQNSSDARPQNGKEIRQILTDTGNLTEV